MFSHESAADLLCAPINEINPFTSVDIFNGDIPLEGFLCRRSDHRYGAVILTRVGGRDVPPRVVYATPKLHYPFGRTADEDRVYHFPRRVRAVEVYEKLDGTNVCAYSYADADGHRYITFKTRLNPILGSSRFGDFAGLWRELYDARPSLRELVEGVRGGELSMSFEIYGYRNTHLIAYPVPLETRLLFGVTQTTGAVLPPHAVAGPDHPDALRPVARLTSADDLIACYEGMRAEAEARNTKSTDAAGSEQIDGTEGYVFYVLDEAGAWTQWKAKPPSVEDLHWSSDYIPDSVILPTVWNSLESSDGVPTVDAVKKLLAEEFTGNQVNVSHNRIEKAIIYVTEQIAWQDQVRAAHAVTGLSVAKDGKVAVMRALAPAFPRNRMGAVHATLVKLGLVPAPPQN